MRGFAALPALDARHPVRRRLWLSLVAGTGFFLLGWGGIALWGGNAHTGSPIWPATAFGLCLILRLSRSHADDAAMLAAMLVAGLAANALGDAGPPLVVGFSLLNIVDIGAGLFAIRRLKVGRITTWPTVARFAAVAAISPALLGAVCAGLLVGWLGADGLQEVREWFLTNFLAVCLIFPFGMTVSRHQLAKLHLKNRLGEALLAGGAVILASLLSFRWTNYHMSFLVLSAAAIAGVRFRLMGAGVALLIVSAIAMTGPVQQWSLTQVELVQLFLAVTSIVSVRAAMLMNERDMLVAIIEQRRRRAVRASRFKSQLLAHVSHEVRTPLSAVIGFSGMLETGALSAERAPEFASIIVHNGELLQRLHDDLLDLSRAEAGALSIAPERVKVAETVFTCVGGIRLDTALGGKHVVIDPIAEELAVEADPVRLAQIINNLIANAYKYGDSYSPIRVSATATEDGFGRIEIVNAGPGIPPEERANIFRPFSRAQNVGRSVPGAGLGLSIAKLLVEMQGGRIDFESSPGRVTRFWVDMPLAA
jgi:signal transduction histidine kinase